MYGIHNNFSLVNFQNYFEYFFFYSFAKGHLFKPLPSLILGLLSLMGAALCLFLPETLNRTLPSSLEDGERFGEGEKFYHFACCDKQQVTESTTILHPVRIDDLQTISAQVDGHRNGVSSHN